MGREGKGLREERMGVREEGKDRGGGKGYERR